MSFLAPALPFISAGAGLLQAFGQNRAGQQAAAASNSNAALYDDQAARIRAAAAIDVATGERQKAEFLSKNRANYAFRGVKISGSPLLVMADNAANLESDIRAGEYNALIGASRASSAAAMERLNASNYKMSGLINAGATLLNTAYKATNFISAPKSSAKSDFGVGFAKATMASRI